MAAGTTWNRTTIPTAMQADATRCRPALDRIETEKYIVHRIRVAGGEGKLVFAPSSIDYIFRYSEGIPRLINVLCDKALLAAYVKETTEVAPELIEAAQNEIEGVTV